jgi:hypothetical protein
MEEARIEFPLKPVSLASFERYSDALGSSGIIWDDCSLDSWLTDPQRAAPKSEMLFEGFDLREPPLIERRRALKELLDETGLSRLSPQAARC